MNLVVDVGNTRVKAAVFEGDTILEIVVFDKNRIVSEVKKILKNTDINAAIISSVSFLSKAKIEKLHNLIDFMHVTSEINTSFKNRYSTPRTLGVDRIALVSAASKQFSGKNVLVIDAGTCITYDFLNDKKEYLGGAISPGIKMRYNSLHTFTSKLPLLPIKSPIHFIGDSTENSINSGVVNGVIQEIEGVINQYANKFLHLTVVLTGGDTIFLGKQLKSSIFANQNFLLEGLNSLLNFNKNK